jgi:hypothetical protein
MSIVERELFLPSTFVFFNNDASHHINQTNTAPPSPISVTYKRRRIERRPFFPLIVFLMYPLVASHHILFGADYQRVVF